MSLPADLKFVDTIEDTHDNAKAMKALTRQDMLAGGFPNALERANPDDDEQVAWQQKLLHDNPERYSGYVRQGKIVAYLKQNLWYIGNELPFATGLWAFMLKVMRALKLKVVPGQWGVLGLVASDELSPSEREAVLTDLLKRSFVDPSTFKARTVNIIVHAHDPLLTMGILGQFGFVPKGRPGEAPGAEGLLQPRYQRRVLR